MEMMAVLITMLMLWQNLAFAAAKAKNTASDEPQLSATAAILIEATTGRVVYEKNADERCYPASMTKMMTAILAIENLTDSSLITVSDNAAATEDSFMELMPLEQLTMRELTTGMMLVSDNGAAVAIAEHISGNTRNFARLMNEKARKIGCTATHFVNPNGLPDVNHYSTARDMAKIAAYCMKNEEFADIVSIEKAPIRYVLPKDKFIIAENTNELLREYKGTIGIKTGWTSAAGGCLAAAAKRNNVSLIAVIMKSEDTDTRFDDAEMLFDYGFKHVKMKTGVSAARTSRSVWIRNGKNYRAAAGPTIDVDYPVIDGESGDKYSLEYDVPQFLDAPAIKGDKIGKLILKYDGKSMVETDVALRETVPQGFSFSSFFLVGFLSFFAGA